MRQLGLVQFFSWFAMFSMWVFTTDAVATHVYGLKGDYAHSVAYNDAGNAVGSSFGIYNGIVAMVYALFYRRSRGGWEERRPTPCRCWPAGRV